MRVQSANNQPGEISQAQAAHGDGPDAEPVAGPSVFDTSGPGPSDVGGRPGDVELKGGSRGREVQTRLNNAKRNLEQSAAQEKRLMDAADAVSAEIRGAQNPDADLQTRLQQARQKLLGGRRAAAAAERQVEDLRREAHQLRQTLQNEHSGLSAHRADGAQLERTTQHEIDVLEAAMRISDHPSADSQSNLQKLQNDLRRIQDANRDLTIHLRDLLLEIRDVPLHQETANAAVETAIQRAQNEPASSRLAANSRIPGDICTTRR